MDPLFLKESRHLIDPAVVTDKAKGYKALQNDIIMLEKKGSEYESRIMKMTKELKHAGLNDKLTHERIIADADALALKQVLYKLSLLFRGQLSYLMKFECYDSLKVLSFNEKYF